MSSEDIGLTGWADPLARLREALERDELVLYCQPIHALRDLRERPLAEVLVRMREEEKALVPPGEFLPVFEHYKMMPELDRWVLRSLIRRHAGNSRVQRFAMNVSRQSLEEGGLAKVFAERIRLAGVSADMVLFEIEEADMLDRPDAVAAFAEEIKAAGSAIVVSGFGPRSVNFMPIMSLHPRYIKVDGSIIRRLLRSPACARKLDVVVRFALSARIGLIAECVEEQEILARLKQLGVGYAQGFGISRPRPISELLLKTPAAPAPALAGGAAGRHGR